MSAILIRHELLRNESIRLATLVFLDYEYVDKLLIAKSGFYYDPWHEMFVCFSCNFFLPKECKPCEMLKRHLIEWQDCWHTMGIDVSIKRKPKRNFKSAPDNPNCSDWFNRHVDMNIILNTVSIYDPPIHEFKNRRFNEIKSLFYFRPHFHTGRWMQ
jgi:hypothetical protein